MFFSIAAAAQSWMQLAPSGNPPSGRVASSMVYISAINRVLIFGGYPVDTAGMPVNDLWALDGANGTGTAQWTELIPPNATGSPLPRTWVPAFYDPSSNRMIVFGGEGGPEVSWTSHNDTWLLINADGQSGTPTWVQLNVAGQLPPPRSNHVAAYDPNTNRLIIYGGVQSLNGGGGCPCDIYGDVWVLSNANGTESQQPVWTKLSDTGSGPVLSQAVSAYDPAENKLIVYGGLDTVPFTTGGDYTVSTATWIFSNANGLGGAPGWTKLATVGVPQQSIAPAGGYDPATKRFIIFGGIQTDQATFTNAVYVLQNATGNGTPTWTLLNVTGVAPSPRVQPSAAYDVVSSKLMIFGGEMGNTFNDSWVLDTIPGTPLVTKAQAMNGDQKVAQGSTLYAGYDFTMPGNHSAATVGVVGTKVTFNATCASGTPGSATIVVNVPDQSYNVTANSSAWYPSGNQADMATYQGSTIVPNFCDAGALVRLQQGGTFSTNVTSTDTKDKVNVRWHYMDGTGGGWSSTYTVLGS
jgi:hypothetical protein